jgi:hypothetical protein
VATDKEREEKERKKKAWGKGNMHKHFSNLQTDIKLM